MCVWCNNCKEWLEDKDVEDHCVPCMAQYGSIVVCKSYCKSCGELVRNHVVDDSGLRP